MLLLPRHLLRDGRLEPRTSHGSFCDYFPFFG